MKYINDRKLPDKAIDLIDQAGSTVKLMLIKTSYGKKYEKEDVDEKIKINVFSNYKSMLSKWGKRKVKNFQKLMQRNS